MAQRSRSALLAHAQQVVVLGLGPTGLSFVRYLRGIGKTCVVNDSRAEPPGLSELTQYFPEVPVHLGHFDDALMRQADLICISQGIATQEPAVAAAIARGQALMSDIELFAYAATAPIVAITGSNAKSTVTTLVGLMLTAAGRQVCTGGNLGTPALDLLLQPKPDVYVIEISNFQLDTTAYFPVSVASVLNISPDHLDRYNHYQDYIAAKRRIYRDSAHNIINRDDKLTWPEDRDKITTSFGSDKPQPGAFGFIKAGDTLFLAYGEQQLLDVNALAIPGQHNWLNALAALAIAHSAGGELKPMLDVLTTFHGLPHRCQRVATIDGVTWYNDSKGTNIGATQAAIQGLAQTIPGQLIVLLGGMGKGADFSVLAEVLRGQVKAAIVFGQDAALIETALTGVVPIHHGTTFDDTLLQAAHLAEAGDGVLLSPACASFDMFKHYEHRGAVFTDWVLAYAKQRQEHQ